MEDIAEKALGIDALAGSSFPEEHHHVSVLPSPFGIRKPFYNRTFLIPLFFSA